MPIQHFQYLSVNAIHFTLNFSIHTHILNDIKRTSKIPNKRMEVNGFDKKYFRFQVINIELGHYRSISTNINLVQNEMTKFIYI